MIARREPRPAISRPHKAPAVRPAHKCWSNTAGIPSESSNRTPRTHAGAALMERRCASVVCGLAWVAAGVLGRARMLGLFETDGMHSFLEHPGPIAFAHRGGAGEAPEKHARGVRGRGHAWVRRLPGDRCPSRRAFAAKAVRAMRSFLHACRISLIGCARRVPGVPPGERGTQFLGRVSRWSARGADKER